MKRVFNTFSVITSIFFVLVTLSFGQARNEKDRYLLRIHIIEQTDSPLRLVVDSVSSLNDGITPVAADDYYTKRPDNVMLRLENVSGSQVLAYALVSKGNGFHNVQVNTLTKPLWPGDHLRRGFGTGESGEIEYSFDYVLFDDGKSWGPDRFGRSRQIALYFDGRNAALEQLRTLSSAYPDPQDFLTRAYSFGGYISHDSASEPNPKIIEVQYRNGWIHIINTLRESPTRQKESRQLADKLEAAIPRDR